MERIGSTAVCCGRILWSWFSVLDVRLRPSLRVSQSQLTTDRQLNTLSVFRTSSSSGELLRSAWLFIELEQHARQLGSCTASLSNNYCIYNNVYRNGSERLKRVNQESINRAGCTRCPASREIDRHRDIICTLSKPLTDLDWSSFH